LSFVAEVPGETPKRRAIKLEKVLGAGVPRHYIATVEADAKPWYLRPNYDPNEILIDPDGGVKGGTVKALIDRLTPHEHGGNINNKLDILSD
jgi:son of sevenless-like protein